MKLLGSASAVLVVNVVTAVPELLSKVTSNGFGVHLANRVKSAV